MQGPLAIQGMPDGSFRLPPGDGKFKLAGAFTLVGLQVNRRAQRQGVLNTVSGGGSWGKPFDGSTHICFHGLFAERL